VTINRGIALLVPVILAGALARASGPAPGPGASVAQLKAISARLNPQGASLLIEATEPAAYVATRPDPLTVDVDFRNVSAEGVANRFAASAKSPIVGVAIEAVESPGGPASRVRITLAQPVAHRVHSERNTIVVDFDKPSAVPYVLPPLSRRGPDAMAALDPVAPRSAEALRGGGPRPAADPIAVLGLTAAPVQNPPQPVLEPLTSQARATPQAPPAPPASQTPPAPPTAPQALGAPRTARTFTGNPVSLDFQGADLRAVLRTFSEISGLNMVIDPSVQGTVDVALRDVPWDQALDIILRANKLGYLVDGTIVRIAPLGVLADEETQKRKLADEQALAGDLRVLTKKLNYAKASDLVLLLTKSALSPRGNVVFDARTNTLIISDLADRLQTSLDLIAVLDRPQPQVEIEARIVQTNKTYARALGIQWGVTGQATPALGNTTNLAFPNSVVINGVTGSQNSTLTPQASNPAGAGSVGTAVNLPAAGATSAIGLALGSINGAFNLDAQLSALESSGKVRLLSTPRVSTQNNVEAQIVQGVQIPYQSGGGLIPVTTTFIPAALTLKVTPLITEAGTVMMQILIDNGSPGALSVAGIPSINTQSAKTTVMVNDTETTVIGGIYASTENSTTDRTPGLSQIPVLKWLFRRDSVNDTNTELIIFITPRIIKG
jgi:type IV pilus assembly protein PilQ